MDLSASEAAIWSALSPAAIAVGTLTAATAAAFRDLVEARAVLAAIKPRIDAGPIDPAALGQYRGLLQRVEALMARFCLAPRGQALTTTTSEPPAADPFAEFFDGHRAIN